MIQSLVFSICLSLALCGLYLLLARRLQLLATPNERSSHERPTPHGGGVGLLVAFALMVLLHLFNGTG